MADFLKSFFLYLFVLILYHLVLSAGGGQKWALDLLEQTIVNNHVGAKKQAQAPWKSSSFQPPNSIFLYQIPYIKEKSPSLV